MREESGHVGSHKVGWFELCVARLILSAQKVFKTDLHLFFNFYLFIYLFLVVLGLSLVVVSYSSLQYMGFSLPRLLSWSTGSRLESFSNCSTGVQ